MTQGQVRVFAYLVNATQHGRDTTAVRRAELDGESIDARGLRGQPGMGDRTPDHP
jgi:hypothetical protein